MQVLCLWYDVGFSVLYATSLPSKFNMLYHYHQSLIPMDNDTNCCRKSLICFTWRQLFRSFVCGIMEGLVHYMLHHYHISLITVDEVEFSNSDITCN